MSDVADFSWVRLLTACFVTLGLLAGLAFVLKYISVRGLALPGTKVRQRRIQIVESLAIDTKRRFVIIRCDEQEHLLLLGGQSDIVVDTNLPSSKSS